MLHRCEGNMFVFFVWGFQAGHQKSAFTITFFIIAFSQYSIYYRSSIQDQQKISNLGVGEWLGIYSNTTFVRMRCGCECFNIPFHSFSSYRLLFSSKEKLLGAVGTFSLRYPGACLQSCELDPGPN